MIEIKIRVSKNMDGYTFSIGPSIREFIRQHFPNAQPANKIFVNYEVNANIGTHIGTLEDYIFPALLGINNKKDLKEIGRIDFIDTQTDKILRSVNQ
jgi:hypothetical protein